LTSDAFGGDKMAGPVIASIETLKSTFADLNLDEILGKGGPALKELTDGLAGFVTNLMPGFNAVMDDSEAIMGVFGDGLADTGDALSDMLSDLLESKGTLEGLHFLFMVLNGTIRGLGELLKWLGDRFHDMVLFNAELTGNAEDVFGWVPWIGTRIREMNDNMEEIAGTAPMMASGMTGTVDPVKSAGGAAAQSAEDFQAMVDTLKRLNEQLYTAQGFMLSADEAADRFGAGMVELTKSVIENGTSLNDHTEQGIKNRQMIRDRLQDLRAQYEADIAAGMAATDASLKYNAQANALQNSVVEMGFAADAVATLIGAYKQIPPVITTEFLLQYTTQGTPLGEHSGARFGETFRITPGGFQEFAEGGMVLGPPGSAQLVVAHAGERVLTPAQQWNGGGGYGGGPQWVAQPFNYSGSNQFEAAMIESIRSAVAARGGQLAVLNFKAPR
jgi:ABC-type transporter Mla subunit MlaD